MIRRLSLIVLLSAGLATAGARAQEGSFVAGTIPDPLPGRVTASGDVYDPLALVAASTSLRLGLRLAVTNPANGRTITVKVIDRGNVPAKLDLLLSRAAAEALQITEAAPVQVRALRFGEASVTVSPTPPAQAEPASVPAPTFVPTPAASSWFQVGAFRTVANARLLAIKLLKGHWSPLILRFHGLFRVYVRALESDANQAVDRLSRQGSKGVFQLSAPPVGDPVGLTTE